MKRLWPIRTYLQLLVLAFAVPLLGLTGYWEFTDARNQAELARGQSLHIAESVAGRTQKFLTDSEDVLGRFAKKPGVRAMDPSKPDPIITTFRDQADLYPQFANIEVVDLSGHVIQSALPQPANAFVSVAATQWFQTARRTGQFVVGEPFIGPITHKWISMLAYPIRDDAGRLLGMLALSIDLLQFRREIAGVDTPELVVTTIVDENGVVIARSSDDGSLWVGRRMKGRAIVDDILSRRSGQARTPGLDGVDRVYGFTTIPKAGWHVLTGIPAEAVFASVRAVSLRSLLLIAAVLGMVLLLGRQLSRSIARPVQRLAEAAGAVAEGHLLTRAFVGGPAEIADVARRFNEMLDVRKEAEVALRMSEDRLAGVISTAMDAIITVDERLRVVTFNVAAERMFMFSAAEAPGQPIDRFIPDRLGAMTGVRSNGEEFPMEASISGVEAGGETLSTIIIRDISERRKQERELARINRLYAALSEVDQTVVRAQTREELLEQVCRALVEKGGLRMAWIGWHDPESGTLVPVAQWGDDDGYLTSTEIYTDDRPESQGPSARAFREGRPQIRNDLRDDPDTAQWRAGNELRGIRGAAAFPLQVQGEVCGTLSLFASEVGHFQSREIALLEEAAADISFALDNLAREDQRRTANEALRDAQARLEAVVDNMTEGLLIFNLEGDVIEQNAALLKMLGFRHDEERDTINELPALFEVSTLDGRSLIGDELPTRRVMRGEVLKDCVIRLRRRDLDSSRVVSVSGAIANYGDDQALAFLTINDVTERAEAETALRMATERLQMLSRRLLEIQETERRRLAIELHDEIGQALTAAKINLQSLQRFPEPANLARRLEDSVQIVDRAFNQVRSLSLELRPSLLDDLGLASAVRWLTAQHAARAGVALHFVSELGDARFEPAVEIASFRIIQEAVNNIVKHAGATAMTVDLRETGDVLHVRVGDDGAGFDVVAARQRAARAASLGMLGMEERASLGSGNIEWLSAPGLHTEVHAWFPLPPKSRVPAG